MAGRLPYLYQKGGSFYVRLVVPKPLRPYVENGKGEILRSLGHSMREAKVNHARALASAQDEIDAARAKKAEAEGVELARASRRYSAMTPEAMARDLYRERLALDEESRAHPAYASIGIDDGFVSDLRRAVAGSATNAELAGLIGTQIERFRRQGNTSAEPSSPEWRTLARLLATAELEALERVVERDEGDFTGSPRMPALLVDEPDPKPAISFKQIIDEEVAHRTAGKDAKGVREQTIKRFRRITDEFAKFRKSDDATTVTHEEGEAWIASLSAKGDLAAKTIGNRLLDLRTVLNWGRKRHRKDFPAANPLQDVTKPVGRDVPPDLRTYTLDEAKAILRAAEKERSPTLRFVPWVTAYSGARISEVANLYPEDFFEIGGNWFYRITLINDRSVKTTSSIRRVPVHPALTGYPTHAPTPLPITP